jgi:hypothetical protein
LLLALGAAGSSRAEDGTDRAAAEALFAEGRRVMASGDYLHACPKFAASQKLDRAVGTSLNLAECYEKSGRIASAWIEFREAASGARAIGSREREQLARERALALEKRLSYLTITAPANARDDLRITRDGSPIDVAALGVALPIDPGSHVIEVTAPGKQAWTQRVELGAAPSRVTVEVPRLGDAPARVAEVSAVTPSAAASTPVESSRSSSASGSDRSGTGQRVLGASLAGLAVVAAGAGAILGLTASSRWSDAKKQCASFPYQCSPEAVSEGQDARSAANIATMAFVIGGVALAGGAVIYFTAPRGASRESGLALHVAPNGAMLSGNFQ